MKRVLMIGMTSNAGGIETYIMNIIRHFKKEYEFYIPYIEDIAYEDELVSLGCKFIKDLPKSRKNRLHYFSTWKKVFNAYKFDIVYINDCDLVNLDILKVARTMKVSIRIFHAHNSSYTWEVNFIHHVEETLNRINLKRIATDLFACSKNAADFMFNGLPYTEIKNGIDIQKFAFDEEIRKKKRKELGLDESQKVILFVGSLTEIKNPLFAIDVIKECHNIDSSFAGVFCGKGYLKTEAQNKIESENMSSYIKLIGSRSDINEIYSAADCMMMPSLFEGFPFVLVEAQCNGLKCICSTNVEQNTNLIGTAEYFSIDEGAAAWAERITAIQFDNEARFSAKEKIADAGYDMAQTAEQIKKFFES